MRWLLLLALAGCASLMDGAVFFEVEGLESGQDIFEAHADALGTQDARYWAASVVVADGYVKASTSTILHGDGHVASHGASTNGVQYIDQSGVYDGQDIAFTDHGPLTPPAGLSLGLGSLVNLAEGRVAITFFSQCSGGASYIADGNGIEQAQGSCQAGDWLAVVTSTVQGEATSVILR